MDLTAMMLYQAVKDRKGGIIIDWFADHFPQQLDPWRDAICYLEKLRELKSQTQISYNNISIVLYGPAGYYQWRVGRGFMHSEWHISDKCIVGYDPNVLASDYFRDK